MSKRNKHVEIADLLAAIAHEVEDDQRLFAAIYKASQEAAARSGTAWTPGASRSLMVGRDDVRRLIGGDRNYTISEQIDTLGH